jgi:hypothetical protein
MGDRAIAAIYPGWAGDRQKGVVCIDACEPHPLANHRCSRATTHASASSPGCSGDASTPALGVLEAEAEDSN